MSVDPARGGTPPVAIAGGEGAAQGRRGGAGTGGPLHARHSVFLSLFAILLAMAGCLLLLVATFFWHFMSPQVNVAMELVVREYARLAAAGGLDHQAALAASRRLELHVRYAGPAGEWTTAEWLPTIAEARSQPAASSGPWRVFYLEPAPDGGTYLFGWFPGARLHEAHFWLLVMLLALMSVVVVVTYVVLRRLLLPLRTLDEGVSRLAAGELDVVLPVRSRNELGALTDAFNRMARQVAEMVRARDRLLGDVSHELRSPLTRMKVALELLPAAERERLAADVAEMEAMVAELLDLERLREGRGVRLVRGDLGPLLREAADAFAALPPGVRLRTAEGALWVDVDAERMRTVLRNLLDNAGKYALADSGPAEVSAAVADGMVVVRVADDGPGVPAADLPALFEPFYRVDRSRSRRTGGYGLGLSICKRIVEAHGGTLAVENRPGRGAVFTLRLPRCADDSAAEPEIASSLRSSQ